jgi:hypothetical protein
MCPTVLGALRRWHLPSRAFDDLAMLRNSATLSMAVTLALVVAACGGAAATPSPNPSGPVALPAGTYQSRVFQPGVTFTLPNGWWIAADEPDYFALAPVVSEQAGIFLFRDPKAASQDASCPIERAAGIGTASTELSAWIRGLPGLAAGNPRLVTVGGLRGTEMDLQIAIGQEASCPFANGLPTVPLFVDETSQLRWVIAGNEQLRVSLLDVPGGGTVVVDIDAFDGSLMANLLETAGPIVNSLKFAAQ